MVEFTHISDGRAQMVDISAKSDVVREALATGKIYLRPATLAANREGTVIKGNVLATARVAATLAVKETPRIIPMCHTILLVPSPLISRKATALSKRWSGQSAPARLGWRWRPDRRLGRAPHHLGHGQVRREG